MSITVTLKQTITINPVTGQTSISEQTDNIEWQYVDVQYSNGYEQFIPNKWTPDQITNEINNTISSFDLPNPPTNWNIYPGYQPPTQN